jgi:hypothetical protein
MAIKQFLKTSGLAALAAVLATTVLPAEASAQSNRRDRSEQRSNDDNGNERRAARIERRGDNRAARVERQGDRQAARVERQGDRAAAYAARNGQPARARQIDRSSERVARRIDNGSERAARRIDNRSERRADRVAGGQTWQGRNVARNGSYANPDRNRTYNRDRNNGNARRWSDNNRRGDNDRWRDNRGDNNRWRDRGDHRRWDRNWHRDNRYNWRSWRNQHHSLFRWGTYYSPYRNYSYRRIGIGFTLGALFYSNRYWINDPYEYRLPEVYGPYRWVRYYDDALLVDIYSGEVVDVIYDFFW